MKGKKTAILGVLIVLTLAIVGCGAGNREMNDEAYLEDLGKGLMARWDLTNNNQSESKDYLISLVDAELNAVSPLSEYVFSSEKLETLATDYLTALNNQKEGCNSYGADETTFTKLFKIQGYNARAKALSQIDDEFEIKVTDKYKTNLDELVVAGKKVIAIEALLDQDLKLNYTGDAYEMIVENTSSYDLTSLQFNFQLLDEDGVVIDNPIAYLDKWGSGEKQKINANYYGDGFSSAKVQIQANADDITTDFVEVDYVNDMIVTLEAEDLPKEVNYGYNNEPNVSCIVNDFSYETGYWSNGKTYLEIFFSGTKTYDRDGDTATNAISFNYRIVDESGTVIDAGSVYADAMKTGDTFTNVSAYTSDKFTPGTYKLIIEDYYY